MLWCSRSAHFMLTVWWHLKRVRFNSWRHSATRLLVFSLFLSTSPTFFISSFIFILFFLYFFTYIVHDSNSEWGKYTYFTTKTEIQMNHWRGNGERKWGICQNWGKNWWHFLSLIPLCSYDKQGLWATCLMHTLLRYWNFKKNSL